MSTSDNDSQTRPFNAVLAEIGGGRLHARLSDQLAELTNAVAVTGKKGQLTITIKVAPVPKADANTLMVTGASSAKVPEGDDVSPTSVFFAAPGGNLLRDNPSQPQLPLVGLPTRKDITA